jgi:hypothetical protein
LETLPSAPKQKGLRIAAAIVTVTLWLMSVFMHKIGSRLFELYFQHAEESWGGRSGRLLAERLIFGTALALGLVVLAISMGKVLSSPSGRRAFPELLARWAAGLLSAWAVNRYMICIQSESVHFAQYGFVAFGLSFAIGNPRLGFALAVFAGFLDESNQWWRMYFNDMDQHLDWSDMCLNACGAVCGALPWTSLARLRRYTQGKEDVFEGGSMLPPLLGIAAIAGLLLFLKTCCTLGHDLAWPYWEQIDNHKPFHQFSQKEGIPALLGISLVHYYLVDERRRQLPICALVLALVAWHVGLTLPADRPVRIHENVPRVTVPKAKAPIAIDGKASEQDWAHATKIELRSFAPDADEEQRERKPQDFGPELGTEARLLWDEKALYVLFRCETKDAWGRDYPRDHEGIAHTPCVEVFLDLDGAEASYYEFEVSAANRQADYFCYLPQLPQWTPWPTSIDFVNLGGWDAKHLESAVSVQGGELELLGPDDPVSPRAKPPTEGYTVEIAIPWGDMKGRAVSPDFHTPDVSPIRPGDRLRANFYRIEPSRTPTPAPTTYLAWSPVHAPLDFHRPRFFGEITLGE